MRYLRLFLCLTVFSLPVFLQAQNDTTLRVPEGYPVIYQADTLFYLYGFVGPFSPKARSEGIVNRLDELIGNTASLNDTFHIIDNGTTLDILNGDLVIMSVTEQDTAGTGKSRQALARQYKDAIQNAINKQIDLSSPRAIFLNLGLLLLAIIILIALFRGVRWLFDWIRGQISSLETNIIFRNNRLIRIFSFITPRRERDLLLVISRSFRYLSYFFVLFFYFPFVFAYLPWTRPYVQKVWSYLSKPVVFVWDSFTSYLPNLFFIVVIIVITRYLIRILQYLAKEIEKEKIVIAGFYGDWAVPTFNLVRVLILAFALIVMFPYLPGSNSPAFQGVSIFLGLLLSLGSSTAVANIVAGLVITYMRPFKIGDRVKIGETVGDVVERSLLVTRLKTIKNEDITIPNANILTGQLKNYTSHAEEVGLILNTSVTIGYDVPWKKVEELLISAAVKTERIEKQPSPFVLKTSLDDFYVSYQLNAYTKHPAKAAVIYSEIHTHILDNFNEAGIEILSPHYGAHRDGNVLTIPPENIPEDYEAPAFRMHNPFTDHKS